MKTKHYEFTMYEVYALRDACVEYYQDIKNLKPKSPMIQKQFKLLEALKEQFKDDIRLWKD